MPELHSHRTLRDDLLEVAHVRIIRASAVLEALSGAHQDEAKMMLLPWLS